MMLDDFIGGKIGLFDELLKEQETDEFKAYETKRRELFNIEHRAYGRVSATNYRRKHPTFISMRAKAAKLKTELYAEQNGLCFLCKKPLPFRYEIDHFIPLIKNGGNDRDNLHVVCPACNRRKAAKVFRR